MDLREAHEVLGIDETVEATAARRAYLKLLKKHRPESDPEGFQRIREAHELVASHRSMFGCVAVVEQSSDGEGQEVVVDLSRTVGAHQGGQPEQETILEPEVPWTNRVSEEVERQKLLAQAPDWGAFFVEQLQTCSEPEDVWDLYYELEVEQPVAAALLRAASQAGLTGFEDSLALTLPELATEQELSAAEASEHDESILFTVFLAAGDLERAGPAAVRALENEHAGRISGYRLIELLFALEASGSERGGPLLFEKINEHIARRLDEPELFGHCVTSWILASEYFRVCSRFPATARVFIGDVCRPMDWDAAPELAMNWRPGDHLTRSQVMPPLREVLSTYAPTLFSVLFPSVSLGERRVIPYVESPSSGMPWWVIGILVFGGFRLLHACGQEGLPSFVPEELQRPSGREQNAVETEPEDAKPTNTGSHKDEAPRAGSETVPLQDSATVGVDGWFALRATAVASFHRAALSGACRQMEDDLADLNWYQRRAPDSEFERALAENNSLHVQYVEQCESGTSDE